MGSVRPLRRFDALEACLQPNLCRDPRISAGPSSALVPLQRRPSQPRPVPPTRGPARRTEQPLLGFLGPTTHSRLVGVGEPRIHPRSRGRVRGLATPCATLTDVLPAREAPERPWASTFRAFPPCAASLLSEELPSWRCRPARRTGGCTRERDRLQGFALGTGPFWHRPLRDGRRCPLGLSPSRAFSPTVRAQRFDRAASPPTPAQADVPAWWGFRVLRSDWVGMVRLRTACSPGIRHLMTVAALRSSAPGAGVWLCLATGAWLAPPSRRSEKPPGDRRSLWPGP